MAKLNSTTIYGALNVFSDVDIDGNLEVNGNLIVNGEIFKLSSILNVNASEFSYNGHNVWHEGNLNPDEFANEIQNINTKTQINAEKIDQVEGRIEQLGALLTDVSERINDIDEKVNIQNWSFKQDPDTGALLFKFN